MAEHDYSIANDTGANVRADINNVLSAIVSNNSKGTEPTTKFAFMWWADTGNDLLKQRNAANDAWISILTLSTGAVTSATVAGLDATPDDDHTAEGPQTNTLNAGYSSTLMDLVYLNANGKWLEADADATGTSINLLGIAMEAKTDGQAMNVALSGSFIRDDTWNWTIGVPLYVSGTLGAITATKPSGSGDVVRTVGYAVTADVIFFNPSSDYVTLA